MADDPDQSADGRDGRRDEPPDEHPVATRLWTWFLLEADRRVVTGATTVGFFLAMVALGAVDPSPLRATMTRTDPVNTLFQSLVAAVITGVTLTLTINQIVLSEELGAVGDQRERMSDALDFRREAEGVIAAPVSPASPAAFMGALAEAIDRRARALGGTVGDPERAALAREVDAFVSGLVVSAGAVGNELEGAEFGTFEVLDATLHLDYSWHLHEARRIRAAHGDGVEGATADAIEEVVEALKLFGTAREHFKTLYFRWELANLSRAMLYVAVPALVVTTAAVLYLDAGAPRGSLLGVSNVVLTVSAATTVAVVPFVTLLAYILRIATVAKRTLSIGPFELTSREGPGVEP